jgi:hypothetical protein
LISIGFEVQISLLMSKDHALFATRNRDFHRGTRTEPECTIRTRADVAQDDWRLCGCDVGGQLLSDFPDFVRLQRQGDFNLEHEIHGDYAGRMPNPHHLSNPDGFFAGKNGELTENLYRAVRTPCITKTGFPLAEGQPVMLLAVPSGHNA